MRKALWLSVTVATAALLSGACSSISGMGGIHLAAADLSAQAKSQRPDPQKALIYVYRNETMGHPTRMEVSLDDRIAGKTGAKTFFMFEVEPGRHEITSEAENTDKLVVNAEAGKAYFVWQEVKMGGWYARNRLHLVDEPQGRAGVAECRLLQTRF